jgi:hypothetical protein
VAFWEEPFDSALYCVRSDGSNAFLVGTARHGMVRLWDKRNKSSVQVSDRSSPLVTFYQNFRFRHHFQPRSLTF